MEKRLGDFQLQTSQIRQTREFPFSDREFQQARRLIYQLAGISMSDLKQDLVYGRLVRRLRATGHTSFQAYLDFVERDRGAEREAFINALTTNLTSFFREPHHFPILADHARKRPAHEPFRVWCAASSTGEEPYSIAITLAEALPTTRRVEILASDIDTQVLATAQQGEYPLVRLNAMSAERRSRFFITGAGVPAGMARVKPELIERIRFGKINLLDPTWSVRGPLDVIFCRNVMIYFDKPTQRKLLERFKPMLRPDGLLICGHSESFQHHADLFRNLGHTVYTPAGPVRT